MSRGRRISFDHFDNLPLAFWKAPACPLHGECSSCILKADIVRDSSISPFFHPHLTIPHVFI